MNNKMAKITKKISPQNFYLFFNASFAIDSYFFENTVLFSSRLLIENSFIKSLLFSIRLSIWWKESRRFLGIKTNEDILNLYGKNSKNGMAKTRGGNGGKEDGNAGIYGKNIGKNEKKRKKEKN